MLKWLQKSCNFLDLFTQTGWFRNNEKGIKDKIMKGRGQFISQNKHYTISCFSIVSHLLQSWQAKHMFLCEKKYHLSFIKNPGNSQLNNSLPQDPSYTKVIEFLRKEISENHLWPQARNEIKIHKNLNKSPTIIWLQF
jgi:hypothetical protein